MNWLHEKLPMLSKFAGAALAGWGVSTNNLSHMSLGAAITLAVHAVDSIFNSPKNVPPAAA